MSAPVRRRSAVSTGDLEFLLELKVKSDAGEVDAELFHDAKRRLLEAPPPDRTAAPGPRDPPPAEELSLLDELREAGALTDDEYALLQRRIVLWI